MNLSALKKISRLPGALRRVLGGYSNWFALGSGAVLLLIGISELTGLAGKTPGLDFHDPICGVPFRYLMLAMGIAHLISACLLLFGRWKGLGFGLATWLAANFLAYRIGLGSMGWHNTCGFFSEPLGLTPPVMDTLLIVASAILLVSCSLPILFVPKPAPRVSTAPSIAGDSGSIKISCPACDGHIQFSAAWLGRTIACPHCAVAITLARTSGDLPSPVRTKPT